MSEYTLYTKSTCKYCTMAKNLLKKHGRDFTEVNIEEIPMLRTIVRQAGYTMVPIIFREGINAGGYVELLEALEPDTVYTAD